ncbi:hypothetical protein [Catellatospora tritici]|uniref:hypothetical protein n=1 Tax=Catellatospora tritici TaxID=2851566 RepID=UPI001C2CDF94|nr:hypothetical protein [Catellatospora tritici]MBV1850869.1 hypothetical protein [Catellatospora tritici]MBV1851122.1 hypothetical protein [Catellatospora tritici]
MRRRLSTLVLALYPRRIRDRYGDEIADLLRDSPRPWRDLADVTWCALGDRVSHRAETITMARVRTTALRTAWLLASPAALTAVLVAFMAMTGPALFLTERFTRVDQQAVQSAYAAMVLPAAVLAGLLGAWTGRLGVARPWLAVPAAMAVGLVAIAAVPDAGQILGEHTGASATAIVLWAAGTAALARLDLALRERGGPRWAARTVGALVVLELATMTYVLVSLDPVRAPRQHALLWYPSAMTALDSGLVDGAYLQLADVIKVLPAMLTMCTVFALTVTAWTRESARTAPQPA